MIPEHVRRNFKVLAFNIHEHPEYIKLKERLEELEKKVKNENKNKNNR